MSSYLSERSVVLGVTGGIAAYKAVEVCRRLVDSGAHVVPVLTNAALRMVGSATFSALASEPVRTSLWDDPRTPIPHITLGRAADVVVVCPATARLVSDLSIGRSGDLLTAVLLATRAPVVVAPAMHTEMWEHPAVQANISTLTGRGVSVVWPGEGRLAGGDVGLGRMAEPSEVVAAVEAALSPRDYTGLRMLVTAGGTCEPIDVVRFVGNRSSGKQGCAIAAEAAIRGADTVLIATRAALPHVPPGVCVVTADTAAEMASAVQSEAQHADVVVMAAAVADFRPARPTSVKLKKCDGVPSLELEPTLDVLDALGVATGAPPGRVLVGFAAETEDVEDNARRKLVAKNLNAIVVNDVSKARVGFEHDTNEVVILTADGRRRYVPLTTKREVAGVVLDVVSDLISRDRVGDTAAPDIGERTDALHALASDTVAADVGVDIVPTVPCTVVPDDGLEVLE